MSVPLNTDDRGLSRWLASRLDARYQLRMNMTKDKLIETLKLAQDALHMATLPFPIDEVKTRRALEAVDKVLDQIAPDKMLFDDWPGGFKHD